MKSARVRRDTQDGGRRLTPRLHVSRLAIPVALAIGVGLTGPGCGGSNGDPLPPAGRLETVRETRLEEAESRPIGNIGPFVEVADGGFIIGDALLPHVRRYDREGHLLREVGEYGEGPFEFRAIQGVVGGRLGQVFVLDSKLARVTVLSSVLDPDTVFNARPIPRGGAVAFAGGLLITTAPLGRVTGIALVSEEWAPLWTVPSPSPSEWWKYPYWGSIGTVHLAASSTRAAIVFSLRYPIRLYDAGGALVDSITAPPTFREAPIVEAGAFAEPAGTDRLEEWLASFDVIANMSVVQDSLLFVAHGTLHTGGKGRLEQRQERVDVYDLRTSAVIASDVPLPANARILGGGRELYVLTTEPPLGWTVSAMRIQGPSQQAGS